MQSETGIKEYTSVNTAIGFTEFGEQRRIKIQEYLPAKKQLKKLA